MTSTDTLEGLWLQDREVTLRRAIPRLPLPPGEALIQPILAGICATDLELIKGYYPHTGVPGHEFVGEVLRCPDRRGLEGRLNKT